jgi:hypothetical protein
MKKAKAADPEAISRAWAEVKSWKGDDDIPGPPVSDWDAERRKRVADEQQAAAPIVDALRDLGIPLDSIWDLANLRVYYPAALPILTAALDHEYPEGVTVSILRALTGRYGPPHVFEARLDRGEPSQFVYRKNERDAWLCNCRKR